MSSTHSSNWLASLWLWSVKYSPLLNLGRWILGLRQPKARVHDLLANADLPQELTRLIETTVRKTRLWKSERIEIAQELITHTQDALEAGRSPDQITESFGNPKKVAKLLKRAAKRKRPLHWRSLQRARQGVAMVIALFCVVYAVQFVRYIAGQPTIETNYVAQVNAHHEAYSEDKKAWPIYKQARIAWMEKIEPVEIEQGAFVNSYNEGRDDEDAIDTGLRAIPHIADDHPLYEQTAQLIRDFSPYLEQVREASHRPIVGMDVGFEYEPIQEGEKFYYTELQAPPLDPNDQPILIDMKLPNLGAMRHHAQLLYFDMLVAARDGDNPRVYENMSAILAMIRQESFDGTLISDLVRIAIAGLANEGIKRILAQHPETLTRESLVNLSHELALVRPLLHLSFDGERMMFDDVLQRIYTDDGNGNGRLTQNGSKILNRLAYTSYERKNRNIDAMNMLTGPIALTMTPDRKSQHETYHSVIDLLEEVQRNGPQYTPLLIEQERVLDITLDQTSGILISPVDVLLPALTKAVTRTFLSKLHHDAAATMLALEIYRIDHGTYPPTLSHLTPKYLPEVPEDLFDPGQPIKYLPTSTGYTLYSFGDDGDDDNAIPVESKYLRFPDIEKRYQPTYTDQGILLDPSGKPVPSTPTGPDGDWIFIEIDSQSPTDPKTKEPDQSPAPESIN